MTPLPEPTILRRSREKTLPFTLGPIAGQDGWQVFNPADTLDVIQGGYVATGPVADLSADLYIASSSTQNEWPFAGLGGPGLAPFIGGIDVLSDDTMQLITLGSPTVGTFARNVWHHVDFQFNITTQTYNFTFDSTLLASGVAFCGDNGPCNSGIPVTAYGNSFFDAFSTAGSNDLGAIDNFSLSDNGSVPEPASVLLIASGLGLLIAKRRRASREAVRR